MLHVGYKFLGMIKIRHYISSVSVQYLLSSLVLLLLLVILTFWVGYIGYLGMKKESKHLYWDDSDRIAYTIKDTFNYVEKFFLVLGKEISEMGTDDGRVVGSVLRKNAGVGQIDSNIFVWSLYNWADNHDYIVSSSLEGEMDIPIRVRPDQRDWITKAKKIPWKLHLSSPAVGMMSKEWIVSVGLGVRDIADRHLGILSMGIKIDKLRQRIGLALGHTASSYAVLTEKGEVLLVSSGRADLFHEYAPKEEWKSIIHSLKEENDAGMIDKVISIGGTDYTYYRMMYPYNYVILLGSKGYVNSYQFKQEVLPQMMITFVIGVIILLYIQQTRLIAPIVALSGVADKIARNESKIIFPRKASYEVNNLVHALIKVKRSFNRENVLRQKLEGETVKAQQANLAKSRFLANMSHELRTPLGAVIGFSELMLMEKNGKINSDQREFLEIIHSSGKNLLNVINDILSLSRVEAGNVELDEAYFNVNKLIHGVVENYREDVEAKNITLQINVSDSIPSLYADKIKIRKVISNVISNAVKFTETGGMIEVNAYAYSTGEIEITVKDNGIGIDRKTLDSIINEFCQTNNNDNRRQQQGAGLGLSIVKQFLHLHDAEFSIDSVEAEGTVVTMRFPMERSRYVQ